MTNKNIFTLAFVLAFAASQAYAQLPSNPWKPNPNGGYFGDNVSKPIGDTPDAPIYEGNSSKGEKIGRASCRERV